MKAGLSNRAFGNRVGVTEGAVRKAEKAGRIKRLDDGSIDPVASLRLWTEGADPARTVVRTGTHSGAPGTHDHARPERGASPRPDAYRDRADLPDDFARGALYGAHLVAFGAPTAAASGAIEAGADPALAAALHDAIAAEAPFLVSDVTAALGLTPPGVEDAGPHAPTAFGGFAPFSRNQA